MKVAANCKHYVAYDLERWNGTDRFHFNAKISDQDIFETQLSTFESCIRCAHGASIMCSFNKINGVPACTNEFFCKPLHGREKVKRSISENVLNCREEYQFDGFVISDCGGVESILNEQNYTKTVEDTVAVALHAGTDLNCGSFDSNHTQEALDKQTIVEADIVRAFDVLIRFGYFDPPQLQIYRQIPPSAIDTLASRQFTLESAQLSMVLLRNLNEVLPLNINHLTNKKIALIGPTANATKPMQGNYFGVAPYLISPLMGFQLFVEGHCLNCGSTL